MVRVKYLSALIIPVILGLAGGLFDLSYLLPFSLISLFVGVSHFPGAKHNEFSFFFPLSMIAYLPANIRLSLAIVSIMFRAVPYAFLFYMFFIVFLILLISLETLIFGIVAQIIWKKQSIQGANGFGEAPWERLYRVGNTK